jgi:hypothetical protein
MGTQPCMSQQGKTNRDSYNRHREAFGLDLQIKCLCFFTLCSESLSIIIDSMLPSFLLDNYMHHFTYTDVFVPILKKHPEETSDSG